MSGFSKLLYLDCSVYGGAFDPEFEDDSLPLIDLLRSGYYRLAMSPMLEDEALRAPKAVAELFRELKANAFWIPLSAEIQLLQQAYLEHGIVGPRHSVDALHVAAASSARCRAIVSWNFKHIVHMDKIPLYNGVNRLLGYNDLAIHSPTEVLRYDNN